MVYFSVGDKKMDTTIKVSSEIHKKIKSMAKKQRRSMKAIIDIAVELLEIRRK